jgi:hypothetical protein
MRAERLLGTCVLVVAMWLTSAATASATSLTPIVPPPLPPTTSTSSSSCPTPQEEPFSWSFDNAIGYYGLLPAQQATGASGTTVSTQTLVIGAGTQTLSITTQGCWSFYGDPENLDTSPFKLLHFSTSQPVEINGIYLVPVNPLSPPTLVVGNDYTLTAFGPPGTDTRYDIEAPSGGLTNGPLSIVGRVDLGAQVYRWDPGSGHLGGFGPSPQGPTFAGQPITGGDIYINDVAPVGSTCYSPQAHVAAYLPLPGEFSSGPSSGSPPSGVANYNAALPVTCGIGTGGSSGGGGGGGGGGKPCGGHVCAMSPDWLVPAHRVRAAESTDLASDPSQPVHLTVSDLWLGGLEIQDAFLDYDPGTDLWTGGGDLQLGGFALHAAPPPPNLGFGVFGNGAFDYGGAQLTLPPPGAPLFTGVNLTELGVSFALHPTTFSGDATISVANGEVTVHGTALVTFADANDPFVYRGQLPGVPSLQVGSLPITSFAAGISGTVDVNDVPGLGSVPLANGYVFYISPGYFEFAGGVSQDLAGIVQVGGTVQGALDVNSGLYNLAGNVRACADFPGPGQVCAGVNAVVSSAGIGACGNLPPFSFGFRYGWGDSLPDLLGPFSCDLGPVTVVVSPARDVAHPSNAATAGPLGVSLPAGLPSTTLWVTSSDGPPRVTITGPHGERLSNSDVGRAAISPGLVIWPEPKLNETLIGIRRPSAGRWTVTPLFGSPAITGLKYANGLPAARIDATVRGAGQKLTLLYMVRRRAGQTVIFAERAGGALHVIGQATGSRGSLGFKPAAGLTARREIVAMISLSGVPSANIIVGHYTAQSAPRPVTPTRVHVLRTGSDLTVSWRPADRWGCLVLADLSDGHRLLYSMPPMRHSLRISRLALGIGARITVTDLGQPGTTSAAAIATVAPEHPSPVTGVTVRRLDRRVIIRWRPAAGATRYLVTIRVRGRTPVTLFGITAEPTVTLIKAASYLLASRDISQITVRAVNLAGQQGSAAIAQFTGRGIPQPPPDRPLRAIDAIE